MRHQHGSVYKRNTSWFLKYYTTRDGKRVRTTELLCQDAEAKAFKASSADKRDERTRAKQYLQDKRKARMQVVNALEVRADARAHSRDMQVATFWELYLKHYGEDIVPLTGKTRLKASTIRGYKQIWAQHLKGHFGSLTLREYTPDIGMAFLNSLAGTQCKSTLKHIRALMCSIFKYAIRPEMKALTGLTVNPVHDILMPEDAIESDSTKHYTLEEAENIVSALKDDVECQLIMALSCFLGLRPSEIVGLQWDDFDEEFLHVRRAVVRGVLDTTKTKESVADIPLVDKRVLIPLRLWRQDSKRRPSKWLFPNDDGDHLHDFGNIIARRIRPVLEKAKLEWKSIYSGRRGACTAAIEATGGNYAVAQQLLRHKSMKTTLDVYKKLMTPEAYKAGMQLLANTKGNKKLKGVTAGGD